ncbi:hypothetical protein [Burkholderia ambifaria]|uniref:hypothetical protein n=1 Tax=Burkholderia ambifaria TaxID=152480 RepID=UPI0031FDDE8B
MSEFACIEWSSVPLPLRGIAVRRTETMTGKCLIAFTGCPVIGREIDNDEIEFPFPRGVELRESLIDWMLYWGIPFRVMP